MAITSDMVSYLITLVEEEIKRIREHKDQPRPYIVDAVDYMRVGRENKRSMLVKGSQTLIMIDIWAMSQRIR